MRKRNLLVFLLLTGVWPVTGLSAQDAWKITAGQIEPPSYYGITVANGMLGLVSSPEPLKISRVVLGGLYDIYGKGRVNNFLHGINMLDTELQINGSTVTASRISGYKQTLDMRQGVFCGEFDYQSLARVEYQYTSLRHLPYSCLLRVRIIPKEDIEVAVANRYVIRRSLSTGYSMERQRLISVRRWPNLRPGNLKSGLVHRLFSMILFPVRKSATGVHAESEYIHKSLRFVCRQVSLTLFRLSGRHFPPPLMSMSRMKWNG